MLTDVVYKEEEQSDVGLGEKWWIFVKLMQAVWEQGSIPEQMKWEIIVLLPKGGGDYRGIGLLEPFWKVVEKIMVARLLSVEFHDSLHGRLLGRGTGNATIEAKLHQSLAWRDQCLLYQIYMDLKKAYDALDQEQTLKILAAYGLGQSCRPYRSISGRQQHWYAMPGVIMGSHLALNGASLRGVRSHLS